MTRSLKFYAVFWLLLAAAVVHAQESEDEERRPFIPRISRETTFITEPLDANGQVDFVAAINARRSEGVTPENNAAVLIFQAGELPSFTEKQKLEFCNLLKISLPADDAVLLKGYDKFKKTEKFYDQFCRCSPWSPRDFPDVQSWIEANQQPLDLAIQGIRRNRYYGPAIHAFYFGSSNSNWSSCGEAAKLLTARSMRTLSEGRPLEAWLDLLDCFRLADHLIERHSLIQSFVARAIDDVAFSSTGVFLREAKLSPGDLERIQTQWNETFRIPPVDHYAFESRLESISEIIKTANDSPEDAAETFLMLLKFKYHDQKPEIEDDFGIEVEDAIREEMIDWNEVLVVSNLLCDDAETAFKISDRQQRLDAANSAKYGNGKAVQNWKKSHPDSLEFLIAVAMTNDGTHACRQERPLVTRRDLLRAAFALARYRAEHGDYPASLGELKPYGLEEIPIDPYSSKPVIYRRFEGGYDLYSVGPNGKDDGGWRPFSDDISVRRRALSLNDA